MLPFANISGDKEEEYFADGMTDDLITDLSKISALAVMSRNLVFCVPVERFWAIQGPLGRYLGHIWADIQVRRAAQALTSGLRAAIRAGIPTRVMARRML